MLKRKAISSHTKKGQNSKPTKSGTHFEGAVKIVLQDILINKTFRKNIRGPEHIFLVKAFDHYV